MGSHPKLGVVVCCMLGVVGCMSPAQEQAQQGIEAFQRCDLRSASQDFDAAHNLDTSRADYALAYALSTIAVLPEDPAVTAVLVRLGFDGPIDTSLLWGKGGVLDQLTSRTATCQSVSDYLRNGLPYPAAKSNGPTAASIVRDSTLNGNDFVAAAAALDPRLGKIVDALEQGAGGMSEMDLQGGCGVGAVHLEAPELYGLAAFLEALRASVQALQGYDWGLTATLMLDDTSGHEMQQADAFNAHLFHLTSAAAVGASLPTFVHAIELLQHGLTAAASIKSRPANSLFDWAQVPANVLADLQTLADSAHQMLTTSGLQPLPFTSPTLSVDARSFFDMPADMTGVQPAIWSAVPITGVAGTSGYSLQSAYTAGVDMRLAPRFSPDPFASGAPSFSFGLSDRWQNISSDTWKAAFDPGGRWEMVYGCSN